MPYLHSMLGDLVQQVLALPPLALEVDPKLLGEEEAHMEALQEQCELFVVRICESVEYMPIPFRWMARVLHDQVQQRFPESALSAVGGFLFLRFICPAMLSPERYGLSAPEQ